MRPKDPMSSCVFFARRVQSHWGLADPLRPDAPPGKLQDRLRREAGVPPGEELAAIQRRLQKAKTELDKAKLTIYPVRILWMTNKGCALELARSLDEQGICMCQAAEDGPQLDVKGSHDEQKILWDTARAFRDHLRKNPPPTEYAMYVDYGLSSTSPGQAVVRYVHFIVCDKAGDWVAVDYQNSHHDDFQRINPKSREDCNRLVVERFKGELSPR